MESKVLKSQRAKMIQVSNAREVQWDSCCITDIVRICFSEICLRWATDELLMTWNCSSLVWPLVDLNILLADNGEGDSRGRIRGSLGGDVPEKYYVVQNNEVMRVKYLLVYVSQPSVPSRSVRWSLELYNWIYLSPGTSLERTSAGV